MKHPALRTEIRPWHGAPTLFVNGKPDTGLMLYHNTVERGHDEMVDFARAGIDLITTGVGGTGCLREDGTLDTAPIDAAMKHILAANPEALVLNRLGLHPPTWWAKQHPADMIVHYDPYLDQNVNAEWTSPAFSSEPWRRDMGKAMQAVIAYCEEHYGDHMLGYHLCSGDCGEWSYAWRHYTQSDYSPAQLAAFRKWLQAQGRGSDVMEIPRDWRRHPGQSCLLDPQRDAALIDYLTFHSETVEDAILHFARLAREELCRLHRTKVIAIFHGYHFPPPGQSSAFCNSGHHSLDRLLKSPNVDILCAPYSYYRREAGGTYFSQLIPGSVRLHGKLYYSEEDTVTHVAKPVAYRYCAPDLFASENVLKRNTLGALMDGGTSWYMDWFGSNWYRDDALVQSIAATQTLARERLDFDNRPVAQVAVVVSERTAAHLRHDSALLDAWAIKPLSEIWRIGAPLTVIRAADLGRLLSDSGDQFRLVIFLDVPTLTPRERDDIRRHAAARGRTLLWTYAPGILHGNALSASAVSELTGIRVTVDSPGPIQVETSLTGSALRYGVEEAIDPVLAGDDPGAEVLGWRVSPRTPALLSRRSATHRAIWSSSPGLPTELVRFFAREAGVHIYSEAGDQVIAEKELLLLHAASDGRRTLRLPHACTVHDAFTSALVATDVTEFQADLRCGQTAVWKLKR